MERRNNAPLGSLVEHFWLPTAVVLLLTEYAFFPLPGLA